MIVSRKKRGVYNKKKNSIILLTNDSIYRIYNLYDKITKKLKDKNILFFLTHRSLISLNNLNKHRPLDNYIELGVTKKVNFTQFFKNSDLDIKIIGNKTIISNQHKVKIIIKTYISQFNGYYKASDNDFYRAGELFPLKKRQYGKLVVYCPKNIKSYIDRFFPNYQETEINKIAKDFPINKFHYFIKKNVPLFVFTTKCYPEQEVKKSTKQDTDINFIHAFFDHKYKGKEISKELKKQVYDYMKKYNSKLKNIIIVIITEKFKNVSIDIDNHIRKYTVKNKYSFTPITRNNKKWNDKIVLQSYYFDDLFNENIQLVRYKMHDYSNEIESDYLYDKHVYIVVPLFNRKEMLLQLVNKLNMLDDTNFTLIISDFSSTDIDIQKLLNSKKFKSKYLKHEGIFSKSYAMEKAYEYVKKFKDSIWFSLDIDISIPRDILTRIRRNIIPGKQGYSPIIIYNDVDGQMAVWAERGTGTIAVSIQDVIDIGGWTSGNYIKRTQWGGDDDQFYNRLSKKGLTLVRKHEYDIQHIWHPRSIKENPNWYKNVK
jgi:hypothetical protein